MDRGLERALLLGGEQLQQLGECSFWCVLTTREVAGAQLRSLVGAAAELSQTACARQPCACWVVLCLRQGRVLSYS